jgi:hypothetical protein
MSAAVTLWAQGLVMEGSPDGTTGAERQTKQHNSCLRDYSRMYDYEFLTNQEDLRA